MPQSPDHDKWEARYGDEEYDPDHEATTFLIEAAHDLQRGSALCLAAGAGRNAVALARQGWSVTAVDIADAGLRWCRAWAEQNQVQIDTVAADLTTWDPGIERWDLVTMISYLQPDMFASIWNSLRPGGHFLLHTFSPRQLELGWGPRSAAHLADPKVIRPALAAYDIVHFEEGLFPRPDGRTEAVMRVLARKPG